MAKATVQSLILSKLENLEKKIDSISTQTIPELMKEIAVTSQEVKMEARSTSKVYGMLWGGVTLLVSLSGLAVAYFK
jgi:hypothetical protein